MANRRIYYAIQSLMIAPDGTAFGDYTSSHLVRGLQQLGINTRFNHEYIFEIGQLEVFQSIENLPDVEVTLERTVNEDDPLIYHMATSTATSPTLAGRSTQKCQLRMSIYPDDQDAASGTPLSETEMSGMFISQLGYNIQINGAVTESVTFIGNDKATVTGSFADVDFSSNDDVTTNHVRRQHVMFGSGTGASFLPPSIRGISGIGGSTTSGRNMEANGVYGASIQSIRVSAGLGRESLLELGRKNPYFRPMQFPVQVQTAFEVMAKDGDFADANDTTDSRVDERIVIKFDTATDNQFVIDLGTRNRLESVQYGNANAGRNGSNATMTYSYVNHNKLNVHHWQDPATGTDYSGD